MTMVVVMMVMIMMIIYTALIFLYFFLYMKSFYLYFIVVISSSLIVRPVSRLPLFFFFLVFLLLAVPENSFLRVDRSFRSFRFIHFTFVSQVPSRAKAFSLTFIVISPVIGLMEKVRIRNRLLYSLKASLFCLRTKMNEHYLAKKYKK